MVDYAKLKLIVGFVIIIAFYSLLIAFAFMSDALEKDFLREIITKEEFDAKNAELGLFIGVSLGIFSLGAAGGGVAMIIAAIKHEAAEGILDSFEGPIEVAEGKPFKYHIRSDPSQSIHITAKKDLIEAIEKSEAFYTLWMKYKTGINTFSYDAGDFLKPLMQERAPEEPPKPHKEKPANPASPQKPSPPSPEKPGEVKPEKKAEKPKLPENVKLEIAGVTIDAAPNNKKALAEQSLQKLFPEFFNTLDAGLGKELFLYYRPILSIRRIDDPTLEDNPKQEIFNKISGIFYLLPLPEDKYYKFPKRLHPKEEGLKIRKTYNDWRFGGFCKGQDLPLFYDRHLLTPNLATDKTSGDARIHALARMTHLAVDADQGLRETIQNLETDVVDLKRKLDAKRDKELLNMLDNGSVDARWRKNFARGPNVTAITVGIMMFFLGYLLKMAIP